MKLSVNWLKDYIDPKLSQEDLIQRLVMAGWEVEAVETIGRDTVFELEITPNRPDCLNVLGLAREIGAITSKKVSYPKIKLHKPTKNKISISITDKKDCSRYIGTLIQNVTVKDSPAEFQAYLNSLGNRPISNAVDITNFVLMETGQPLHVFDYDKIIGGKIIVRRAKEGETITTIDGIERKLDTSILVIADAQKAIAIAGIMGGKDTEVTGSTRNILLESAHFDMGLVRRASRKLGLRSDSSYRFERNVDWQGVLTGANRATDLLLELTKGQLVARTDVSYATKTAQANLKISSEAVEALLGVKVALSEIKKILTHLDFKVSPRGKTLLVVAPHFRGDIKQEVDLIEEIARMIGFDRLPSKLPVIKAINIPINPRPRQVKNIVRNTLCACGLDETVTFSMTNTKALAKSGLEKLPAIKVFNPLSQDQELMRPALLPSLLQVVLTNVNRGQKELRLFEIGKRYLAEGEKNTLGIIIAGSRSDFFYVKGILEVLFKALEVKVELSQADGPSFDASCAAVIKHDTKEIGAVGKISSTVLNQWDIKLKDLYFVEIDLEALMKMPKPVRKYDAISEFPAVTRDVSIAVSKDISYGSIEALCRHKGGSILSDVKFIEQYLGDKIQKDKKGIVFSCIYQSKDRTLREEEVNLAHQHIIQALTSELQATLR